jgi:hypothetical protein
MQRRYCVGPSWLGLATCAIGIGIALPGVFFDVAYNVPIPWYGTIDIPQGAPWWILAVAGVIMLVSSSRSIVIIDEKARTITKWRCLLVFLPYSVRTHTFGEVRCVRVMVGSGASGSLSGEFLGGSGGGDGEGTYDTYPNGDGPIVVNIIFQDRDWAEVGVGSERHMVALGEELRDLLETRLG